MEMKLPNGILEISACFIFQLFLVSRCFLEYFDVGQSHTHTQRSKTESKPQL